MNSDVAILGVGMHPWGKWNRNFVEYGVLAARAALKNANVLWRDVQFISASAAPRCGYPGLVAAASFAEALGWQGAELQTCYAACVSGAQALAAARAKILSGACELALVIGADVSPKGFLKPEPGERPDDPNWMRYYLGFTNPTYLALDARRRMELYGATADDFSTVKVKNARHGALNSNARYRYEFTLEQVNRSAMVADPLRLFHICSTSDGGAAVVLSSLAYAKRMAAHCVLLAAVSTCSPRFPNAELTMPYLASDSSLATPPQAFHTANAMQAYEEAGMGPEDLSLAEVYDLSSATELDWYEHIGLCARGQAEGLLREGVTQLGGRLPVNASGGLASFGEAMSAQVLAQVCELTWQLRGQAGARQVANANTGIAVSQGIYGHGGAIIIKR